MSSQDQKLLTQYPHLRRYLVQDGEALRQFNLLCTQIRAQAGVSTNLQEENAGLRRDLKRLTADYSTTRESLTKTKEFLFHLGELLEKQTGLSPEDLKDLGDENISAAPIYLPPVKLCLLLECYWDWVADELERKVQVNDPALDRGQKEPSNSLEKLLSDLYTSTAGVKVP